MVVVHISSDRSEDLCHLYQGSTGIVVVLLGQCRLYVRYPSELVTPWVLHLVRDRDIIPVFW